MLEEPNYTECFTHFVFFSQTRFFLELKESLNGVIYEIGLGLRYSLNF